MKGKYYGVYDVKHGEKCVGIFESVADVCGFFGGISQSRVWCAVTRKNPLAFKSERYWVEVFEEPTEHLVRKLMRQRFGKGMYRINADGVFFREQGVRGWRLLAVDFEGAVRNIS